jgi:hypothetical protein
MRINNSRTALRLRISLTLARRGVNNPGQIGHPGRPIGSAGYARDCDGIGASPRLQRKDAGQSASSSFNWPKLQAIKYNLSAVLVMNVNRHTTRD